MLIPAAAVTQPIVAAQRAMCQARRERRTGMRFASRKAPEKTWIHDVPGHVGLL